MLVAQLDNDKLLSLADGYSYTKLMALRETNQFRCPGCQSEVILKLGAKRRWHFSHLSNQQCSYHTEAETDYHLMGKEDLYHWLKVQSHHVQLECYLPDIHQRPDLLISSPYPQAIEFQCATIPTPLLKKRTENYERLNMTVVWILGEKRLHQVTPSVFQLHEMDWQAITSNHVIYYYSPETKYITRLSQLLPISTTKLLATPESRPLIQWTYPWPLPSSVSSTHYLDIWYSQKKHWRLTSFLEKSSAHSYVKAMYLRKSLSLSQFPPFVGLPLKQNILIRTPAFLWQSWIYCQYLQPLDTYETVSLNKIYPNFLMMFNKGIFIRTPLPKEENLFQCLKEYFKVLMSLEVVYQDAPGIFGFRQVQSGKQIEDLLWEDKKILKKLINQMPFLV